jgi:hypothetical protein
MSAERAAHAPGSAGMALNRRSFGAKAEHF